MEAAVGAVATKVVEGAVDLLLTELLSRAKRQLHFVLHLEDEIRFLEEVLPDLKEVIWSAEVKPETAEMHSAWQGFVGDAEDILDDYSMRTAQRHQPRSISKKPVSKVRRLKSRIELASRIKGLYDGLEKLKNNVNRRRQFVASVRFAKKEAEGEAGQLSCRPTTYELLEKNFRFVGREKTKKEIMAELLMSQPSSSKPAVVLVTGMGGVGKTTLVQDILRQGSIVQHFGYRKWVCVGDELDLNIVTKAILDKDGGNVMEIRSKLEGQRFLIALDDCWSGKLKSWKDLWVPLSYGSDGSKVLITSREDISSELLPAFVKKYELGILSNEECLQIFESYAFPNNGVSGACSTSILQDNEKNLLNEKIKGLPLAAMVLGSSLRNVIRIKWVHTLKEVVPNDIMSVLMWSYRCLPWYLKQCFAYLSVFPKDYKLDEEHVVWMWMAQGYVQPKDDQTLEIIGKDYFNDLVRASLLQKEQYYEGSDAYYKMHDLVHDLAMNVCVGGCVPYNHLSITDNKSSHEYFDKNKKLRTLLILCEDADITKLQLQHVRVLLVSGNKDVARINFSEMIYIRYLDLEQADALTQSICCMYNLQTLLLHKYVKYFPQCTWNLPNLRHLMGGDSIPKPGIGNSKSLHRLGCFNLFHEGADINELTNLKELRKLRINNLHRVTSPQHALEAQLHDKKYIEDLALYWDFSGNELSSDKHQNGILENLRPHQSLRTLEINSYRGDQLPSWMSRIHLPHLVKLTLSWLYHIVELPPLGDLPLLEHLVIDALLNVRCIGNGFYGSGADHVVFPSLKILKIKNMMGLEEWKEWDRRKDGFPTCFPSLERLGIARCRKLRSMLCHLPRCLKKMSIVETRLEALPEIESSSSSSSASSCTDDHPEYCYHIRELTIWSCPSLLHLDEWFRTHPMPSLQMLYLERVGHGFTNLVINYSRKCLTSVKIKYMCALRSITLSNMVPLNEFREADYKLLVIWLGLDVVEEVSIVNREGGKITAGPLQLSTSKDNGGAAKAIEKLSKMMMQDEEYIVNNDVKFYEDEWYYNLEVEPRN